MRFAVVCIDARDLCGLNKTYFYKYGIDVALFIEVDHVLDRIRSAIKDAFDASEAVCVLYSKSAWPNLQKTMLMEFERSSVFVDTKTPYVVANGFQDRGEGVFFDIVYDKPFLFIPSDLKDDISLESLMQDFTQGLLRVGLFNEKIDNKYVVYADEAETVLELNNEQFKELTKIMDKHKIYTTNGESPQQSLFKLLKSRNSTISVAESCTAGLIASMIADIPGSSQFFKGGCVTYSNEMKSKFLGVNSNTLETYGAVSKEIALQMAIGMLNNSMSNFSVAVTGIAGPGGATKQKPVGLVYIAVSSRFNSEVKEIIFSGNRRLIRHKTAKYAILYLRDFILRQ